MNAPHHSTPWSSAPTYAPRPADNSKRTTQNAARNRRMSTQISKPEHKSKPFWRRLGKKKAESAGHSTSPGLVSQDPFSSMRLPDMDFRTERLSVTPIWSLASEHAEIERKEAEEKQKRDRVVPPRPVHRMSTQKSWRSSSRRTSTLQGPSQAQRRRSRLGGLMNEPRSQASPPPSSSDSSSSPTSATPRPPTATTNRQHGRQLSQCGPSYGSTQKYHLPSSRMRGAGGPTHMHVRPSPQRKPTITSIESAIQEDAEEEHMLPTGPTSSKGFVTFSDAAAAARPPPRSSSMASMSSHTDAASVLSGPSAVGYSGSRMRPSLDHSQETAPTSVSGCSEGASGSWLSDSDSDEEDLYGPHIPMYAEPLSQEDEEDVIDPLAGQLNNMSIAGPEQMSSAAAARHENLLARKYSIERAAKTRLARTPSKRVKYPSQQQQQ